VGWPSSWSHEASDAWAQRFDGTAPGGRIGRALKALERRGRGWAEVRDAWNRYLEQTEARFASPERFAATYGQWSGTAPPPQAPPTTRDARTFAAFQDAIRARNPGRRMSLSERNDWALEQFEARRRGGG
jgi:hypothetical protein